MNPNSRDIGIACGLAYLVVCDEILIYDVHGVSTGMAREIDFAREFGIPMRWIDKPIEVEQ
jgi:hypothetical protein